MITFTSNKDTNDDKRKLEARKHTHSTNRNKRRQPTNMSSVEESLFISQFLAAYGSQETKFPSTYVPSGLAPSWTSKVREREAGWRHVHQVQFRNNERRAIEEEDCCLLMMAELMYTVNILDANKAETDCDLLFHFANSVLRSRDPPNLSREMSSKEVIGSIYFTFSFLHTITKEPHLSKMP